MADSSHSQWVLRAGIYRHYKGPLYQVFGYGHDANDDTRVTVVYIGLQLDGSHSGARLATRDAHDFFARVCVNHNCVKYGQAQDARRARCMMCTYVLRSRFTYMSSSYHPSMIEPTLDGQVATVCEWVRDLRAIDIDVTDSAPTKTAKEAAEFADNPCLEEAADVFISLMGAVCTRGWSANDLARAVKNKLEVNRGRSWEQLPDGTYQHVRVDNA